MKKYLNEIVLFSVGVILMGSSWLLGIFIRSSSRFNVYLDQILYKVKDYVFLFGFILVVIAAIIVIIKITELYLKRKDISLNDIEKTLIFLSVIFLLIIPIMGVIFLILILLYKWMEFESQKEEK